MGQQLTLATWYGCLTHAVLKELHARLAMLEERVSNVDHENAVLRAALERQVADVNKRVAQSNQV